MLRILTSFILTIALTLVSVSALAQPLDVPPMRGVINDPADLLSGQEYVALLDDVSAINTRTHAQTAILVLPELKGDNLERFATRTFNTWRLGNAQRNDGVLILVAWHDRLVRIETGRGLQKTIPDALASRVIKEQMLPWFRAGDLTAGLRHGLTGINALLSH
ncbi:TPM domain-containing protein, partial [Cronobacter sakazakii]